MLKNRDFLKIADFHQAELDFLLKLAARLKALQKSGSEPKLLLGKKIALIFEKDSTRTRCSFECAAFDQGAFTTYLGPTGAQVGKKESFADTARVLERMYDAIEYRGFAQANVELLAQYARVPVWNGLTDEAHPTQILADLLTMREHSPKPLDQVKLAYLGDARFNMGNSLMLGAAKLGLDYRSVAPAVLQTSDPIYQLALAEAAKTGAKITLTDDLAAGVKDCDFIYTDVWVSMGETEQTWQERIALLLPYQVNAKVMALTNNPAAKFLHCLPAFHDTQTQEGAKIHAKYGLDALEVSHEVFESPACLVFEQAENRLHTIKAVMVATLADLPPGFLD